MKLFDWEGPLPRESSDEYHSRDLLSSTQIKEIENSPWHYKRNVIDGDRPKTQSLSLGTIVHQCILENDYHKVVTLPSFPSMAQQKKDGIENPVKIEDQKEQWIKDNSHKIIVTEGALEKVNGMLYAVKEDALAQEYLTAEGNIFEQGYAYWDERHQVRCSFRPDVINFEKGFIVDYKTTKDARWEKFKWAIKEYGYHTSAAHYMIGADRLFPGKIKQYIFVAQSNLHPFACGTYELEAIDLCFGETIRSECLEKIHYHTERNYWPGYTEKIRKISTPNAALEETEDETEESE